MAAGIQADLSKKRPAREVLIGDLAGSQRLAIGLDGVDPREVPELVLLDRAAGLGAERDRAVEVEAAERLDVVLIPSWRSRTSRGPGPETGSCRAWSRC